MTHSERYGRTMSFNNAEDILRALATIVVSVLSFVYLIATHFSRKLSHVDSIVTQVAVRKAIAATCTTITLLYIPSCSLVIYSIHDHSMVLGSETESSLGLPDSASESGSISSPHWVHSQLPEEKHDRNVNGPMERNNYYPITWRIIGGGVMMSGSRRQPYIVLHTYANTTIGEICQDYVAGHCSEGLDCKFSHPASVDEQEPIAISEFRTAPFYVANFSPTSSVHLLPVPVFVRPPPRRRPRRTPQHREVFRPHRDDGHLLDGDTLAPTRMTQDIQTSDDPSNDETSTSTTSPSPQLFLTRPIERPVSTPPSDVTSFAKVLRVRFYTPLIVASCILT
jgi:hypothetical protein